MEQETGLGIWVQILSTSKGQVLAWNHTKMRIWCLVTNFSQVVYIHWFDSRHIYLFIWYIFSWRYVWFWVNEEDIFLMQCALEKCKLPSFPSWVHVSQLLHYRRVLSRSVPTTMGSFRGVLQPVLSALYIVKARALRPLVKCD